MIAGGKGPMWNKAEGVSMLVADSSAGRAVGAGHQTLGSTRPAAAGAM
jgi:hypothetical protein